jgi:hypothetical protein
MAEENIETKFKRLQTYLPIHLKNLLAQRANDEHISEGKLVRKILTLYLTKDIEEESLLIAKMTELLRQVMFIEKKLDLGQKKDMQWEQFMLAFQPELPKDARTRALALKRATDRYGQFLTMFRNKSRKIPAMLEAILGDMLEEEAEPVSGQQEER